MVYGYARVSTKGQEKNGTSLEDQQQRLKDAGAEVIFCDAFTGTKKERPELSKLLNQVCEGDTIVITKLDRVARSIAVGAELIDNLMNKGIRVNILNLGILDNTPNGKLMRNIFLAFAEFERDMIVERTTEGRAIKRENDPDFKEGRKKIDIDEDKLNEVCIAYKKGEKSYIECAAELGLSSTTFGRRLNEWKKNNPNWKELTEEKSEVKEEKPELDVIQKAKDFYSNGKIKLVKMG